jgi:phenylacetate-coenzyme A ligase PaaK-like adenylate-forming protein
MSRTDLQRLQESRLMHMLDFACARAPLVKKTWKDHGLLPRDIKSLDNCFSKAPLISKDSVRAFRDAHGDLYGGLYGVSKADLKGLTFTSGTTGDPTPVRGSYRAPIESAMMRDIWMLGSRPGDYVVALRSTFGIGHIGPCYQDPPSTGFLKPAIPAHLKAWRDIWSAGHGVGLIEDVPAIEELVGRLDSEYQSAKNELAR